MEKGPEFKVIGNVPKETKEKVKETLRGRLFEKHLNNISDDELERLKKNEYEKNSTEIALIDFANQKTNELMKQAGTTSYDVPYKNFHIIQPELYKEVDDGDAVTICQQQVMAFNAESYRNNPVYFGKSLFHELLHLKAHFTMEAQPKGEGEIEQTCYRTGVSVGALQQKRLKGGYYEHFQGLHEAIVGSQEKAYVEQMLKLPELEEEKKWLSSPKAQEIMKKIAKKENCPEDEIVWVSKNGKDFKRYSYRHQRRVLDYIVEEIQKEFSDKYQSAEEVRAEFLKSHFNGRLLPIARLVDKAFGEGSFRALGMMTEESDSAIQTFEILRKARVRRIKK